MSKITTYTERQAVLDNVQITMNDHEVQSLLNLDEQMMKWHGLRRGDVLTINTVKVSVETAMQREFRFGFDGQRTEQQLSRKQEIIATETRKLWKTKKRGWYWK